MILNVVCIFGPCHRFRWHHPPYQIYVPTRYGNNRAHCGSRSHLTARHSAEVEPGMGLRFADIPEAVLMRIRSIVQSEMMGGLDWKKDI